MTLYSVSDIARALGIIDRRVRYHCKLLYLPKVGATYVITDADRQALCERIALAHPGRPPRIDRG